ncbi:zinc finger domain-containing protein [Pimelobacter simplex]|uniref:zinc finger domain-containing protein n=1 Tax=Nocardioides simplex TaxID=2045 RepID=UPI004040C0F6
MCPKEAHVTNFYDIDLTSPEPRPRFHGALCTAECGDLSQPCHLTRSGSRPPQVPCPHCGAAPGSPCLSMNRARRRLTLTTSGCHPSRLEAA